MGRDAGCQGALGKWVLPLGTRVASISLRHICRATCRTVPRTVRYSRAHGGLDHSLPQPPPACCYHWISALPDAAKGGGERGSRHRRSSDCLGGGGGKGRAAPGGGGVQK